MGVQPEGGTSYADKTAIFATTNTPRRLAALIESPNSSVCTTLATRERRADATSTSNRGSGPPAPTDGDTQTRDSRCKREGRSIGHTRCVVRDRTIHLHNQLPRRDVNGQQRCC